MPSSLSHRFPRAVPFLLVPSKTISINPPRRLKNNFLKNNFPPRRDCRAPPRKLPRDRPVGSSVSLQGAGWQSWGLRWQWRRDDPVRVSCQAGAEPTRTTMTPRHARPPAGDSFRRKVDPTAAVAASPRSVETTRGLLAPGESRLCAGYSPLGVPAASLSNLKRRTGTHIRGAEASAFDPERARLPFQPGLVAAGGVSRAGRLGDRASSCMPVPDQPRGTSQLESTIAGAGASRNRGPFVEHKVLEEAKRMCGRCRSKFYVNLKLPCGRVVYLCPTCTSDFRTQLGKKITEMEKRVPAKTVAGRSCSVSPVRAGGSPLGNRAKPIKTKAINHTRDLTIPRDQFDVDRSVRQPYMIRAETGAMRSSVAPSAQVLKQAVQEATNPAESSPPALDSRFHGRAHSLFDSPLRKSGTLLPVTSRQQDDASTDKSLALCPPPLHPATGVIAPRNTPDRSANRCCATTTSSSAALAHNWKQNGLEAVPASPRDDDNLAHEDSRSITVSSRGLKEVKEGGVLPGWKALVVQREREQKRDGQTNSPLSLYQGVSDCAAAGAAVQNHQHAKSTVCQSSAFPNAAKWQSPRSRSKDSPSTIRGQGSMKESSLGADSTPCVLTAADGQMQTLTHRRDGLGRGARTSVVSARSPLSARRCTPAAGGAQNLSPGPHNPGQNAHAPAWLCQRVDVRVQSPSTRTGVDLFDAELSSPSLPFPPTLQGLQGMRGDLANGNRTKSPRLSPAMTGSPRKVPGVAP